MKHFLPGIQRKTSEINIGNKDGLSTLRDCDSNIHVHAYILKLYRTVGLLSNTEIILSFLLQLDLKEKGSRRRRTQRAVQPLSSGSFFSAQCGRGCGLRSGQYYIAH